MRELASSFLLTVAASALVISCSGEQWGGPTGGDSSNDSSVPAGLASCGTNMQLFSTPPVPLARVAGWVPLGAVNPPAHTFPTDHQYIYLLGVSNGVSTEPLFAPGNMTVTRVRRVHYSSGTTADDYSVEFMPCREVRGEFGHVRKLSSKILNALGAADQQCMSYSPSPGVQVTTCATKYGAAPVLAGDTIGATAGLDLSLFDQRIAPLSFANGARWTTNASGFDHFHVVPFSDYYAEPARGAVRAVLGSFDGRTHRVAEPAGGSIATDIAGTAQGAWFHPSQPTNPEGPHLAITPDAVDPSRVLVSIGLSQPGLGAGAYVMVPATSGTTNRAPWLITPGSTIHCWEIGYGPTDRRGVLLVALDDATTLRVEARPGATQSCESSPYAFTTNSFTYKR